MIRQIQVVVPSADEEERIGACLAALSRAVRHLHAAKGGGVSVDVLVVLDACRDRTAEVVARFAGVRTIVIDQRSVGAARAAGVRAATRRGLPARDVWLASTDADTQVSPGWLTYMARAADRGADVVLGTVRPTFELPPAVHAAWLRAHRLEDGHPHVHGANLGIRASTLNRLGGWAPLTTGEDVELVERAAASDARILRTGAVPSRTSARTRGRAPVGFSSYLRGLSQRLREADDPGVT